MLPINLNALGVTQTNHKNRKLSSRDHEPGEELKLSKYMHGGDSQSSHLGADAPNQNSGALVSIVTIDSESLVVE